jgi:hypothetical protein
MTRRTNARIAGIAFLLYIAVGMSGMAVPRTAPLAALIPVLTSFCAIVLGVTLFALTHDQDRDLALLALACRVVEGVADQGAIYFAVGSLLFAWLLLRGRMVPVALAWLGVVASVLVVVFVPMQLAGYFGGPGSFRTPASWVAWLPMLAYEVALALWLIFKGASEPGSSRHA